jgi:hypothetical protein
VELRAPAVRLEAEVLRAVAALRTQVVQWDAEVSLAVVVF